MQLTGTWIPMFPFMPCVGVLSSLSLRIITFQCLIQVRQQSQFFMGLSSGVNCPNAATTQTCDVPGTDSNVVYFIVSFTILHHPELLLHLLCYHLILYRSWFVTMMALGLSMPISFRMELPCLLVLILFYFFHMDIRIPSLERPSYCGERLDWVQRKHWIFNWSSSPC